MTLPAGFRKSGGKIVNEDGVELVALDGSTVSVESRSGQITAGQTNGSGDGAGDVYTYTETLPSGTVLNWTLTYNSDGSIHTLVHA